MLFQRSVFPIIMSLLFSWAVWAVDCEVEVPGQAERLIDLSDDRSKRTYLVCNQQFVALTGDGNLIYLMPGATLSVAGRDNTIYASARSTVQLMGGANLVVHDKLAMISDMGTDNRLDGCPQLSLTLPEVLSECAGSETPRAASPVGKTENRDLGHLIGRWTITEARLLDRDLVSRGEIVFAEDYSGFARFEIQFGEKKLPGDGPFQWQVSGSELSIKAPDRTMTWRRLEKEPHRQTAEFEMAGEGKVVLVLIRSKAPN